jgi:putative endonuclease
MKTCVESQTTWHVYILECNDGTLYTGITINLALRFQLHQLGRGAKYTRTRRPIKLLHVEERIGRGAAQRREAQIKKLTRKQKLKLIAKYWNEGSQCF